MPSTSDAWSQALYQYQRGGGSPSSLTALEGFDPTAALQQYGSAAAGDFNYALGNALKDLQGRAASAGRLKTGFYDQDVGRLTQSIAGQYQRDLASQAMNAASLKANTLGRAAGMQENEQDRYLEMLSGQLDREQAQRNANAQSSAGLLGGLGSLAGTLGGAAIMMSSRRFKTDEQPLDDASARVAMIPGRRFRYLNDDQPQVGVMAEDVDRALPEAVAHDDAGRPMGVDYLKLVPLALEAVREQGDEIARLRAELRALWSGASRMPSMEPAEMAA